VEEKREKWEVYRPGVQQLRGVKRVPGDCADTISPGTEKVRVRRLSGKFLIKKKTQGTKSNRGATRKEDGSRGLGKPTLGGVRKGFWKGKKRGGGRMAGERDLYISTNLDRSGRRGGGI